MGTALPFAVRVVAGLIATGIERIRTLPEDLPGLSVTLAGQAARASMRLQQGVAALAETGDEVIRSFTQHAEERPAWAHFDEDDAADASTAGAAGAADAAGVNGYDASHGGSVADAAAEAPGPAAMPGYDELRLAQVRARMRGLDADQVAALLAHERAGGDRAAFVTLLQNRLTMLAAGGENGAGLGGAGS